MSDAENPYQSPETEVVPERPFFAQGALTETMLVYLKDASPWLRFAGILGFISSGLTVLTGFSLLAVVPLMGRFWEQVPGAEPFSSAVIHYVQTDVIRVAVKFDCHKRCV